MTDVNENSAAIKSRIKYLHQIREPLKEHWNSSKVLDRCSGLTQDDSDLTFKTHLSRLRDIYKNQKFTIQSAVSEKDRLLRTTPLQELYGIDGLYSKLKGRGHPKADWDNNVHNTRDNQRIKSSKSALVSSMPSSGGFSSSLAFTKKMTANTNYSSGPDNGLGTATEAKTRHSSRYPEHLREISPEDLIVLNMYRLTEAQANMYSQFVDMLKDFDPHDIMLILEDALRDVYIMNSTQYYTGIDS